MTTTTAPTTRPKKSAGKKPKLRLPEKYVTAERILRQFAEGKPRTVQDLQDLRDAGIDSEGKRQAGIHRWRRILKARQERGTDADMAAAIERRDQTRQALRAAEPELAREIEQRQRKLDAMRQEAREAAEEAALHEDADGRLRSRDDWPPFMRQDAGLLESDFDGSAAGKRRLKLQSLIPSVETAIGWTHPANPRATGDQGRVLQAIINHARGIAADEAKYGYLAPERQRIPTADDSHVLSWVHSVGREFVTVEAWERYRKERAAELPKLKAELADLERQREAALSAMEAEMFTLLREL